LVMHLANVALNIYFLIILYGGWQAPINMI
jgi:hypothetical protein